MLIAHISDPHVTPPGTLYQGVVDANAMFANAIRQVNALSPDLVLLSGDLVEHGRDDEYDLARNLLSTLRAPLLVIPGNHDDHLGLRAAFRLPGIGPMHSAALDCGPVRVIGLDVTVPGAHHGLMDDAASAWLETTLASDPNRPTIIMMHQPPFSCGIASIDPYWCRDGDRLRAIVARYPAVERVVCGHLHRAMQLRFAGTVLCVAPSTTTAIALDLTPGAPPASYIEPPGLLLHHWRHDIGLITHHVPIGNFPGPFPFA